MTGLTPTSTTQIRKGQSTADPIGNQAASIRGRDNQCTALRARTLCRLLSQGRAVITDQYAQVVSRYMHQSTAPPPIMAVSNPSIFTTLPSGCFLNIMFPRVAEPQPLHKKFGRFANFRRSSAVVPITTNNFTRPCYQHRWIALYQS